MPDVRPPKRQENFLAIIPARAGSKGIPGKNLRVIAGRSLIGWSVHAARQSRFGLRVMVSTDGAEIADEARRCGAEVLMRPPEISGDKASSEAALLHVLDELEARERYVPEVLVFLQCTSPLTAAEDIDGVVARLLDEQADSALAVVPFHYFLWRRDADGDWNGINHDKDVRLMRQDREAEFLETGAIYAMRVPGFREARHRFFGKTVAYEMPEERRLEIDEPADLERAEYILSRRQPADAAAALQGVKAVVFDFDGVMTDNRVLTLQDGSEGVVSDRSDGLGISRLRAAGFPLLILSKERNAVVAARGQKVGIEVRQGIDAKRPVLETWCAERGVALADVAFVGNDLNDLECLRAVGHPVVVADAYPEAKAAARLVLSRAGGQGAVRELADLLLQK